MAQLVLTGSASPVPAQHSHVALRTAGSPWVGGRGGPHQPLWAQLCPAVGPCPELGDSCGDRQPKSGVRKAASPTLDPFLSHAEAAQQCWPFLPILCRLRAPAAPKTPSQDQSRAQARAGGTQSVESWRGTEAPKHSQGQKSRQKDPQVLGVSPADLSLQQRWEFMNPKPSRGVESQLFIAETNGARVPALCSQGQMGSPHCRWPLVQKGTGWLCKEGDEAFPTESWVCSGFPSLVPAGRVGEEPSTHPAHTRDQGTGKGPAAFQEDPCCHAGGGDFAQGHPGAHTRAVPSTGILDEATAGSS